MNKRILAVILTLVVGLAMASPNISTVSDPNAKRIPADPNAPLCVEVPVPTPPITDAPPPFGTVVQQWNLSMSGSYVGSGITWKRDSSRFYLMDQGRKVWSLDPLNPTGTMRDESWVFPNLGSGTLDISWGLAGDADSNCFWISQILDGSVYSGCYLLRMTADGTWAGGTADSWRIDGVMNTYWIGGMEKWQDRGFFAGTPVASGSYNNTVMFDPYTKTVRGRTANGPSVSERGTALVPWDSLYILTTGWNESYNRKRDTTGYLLQQVNWTVYGPADWAVWVPQTIYPTDTVFAYLMCNDPSNTLQKISCGMTWDQLPSVEENTVRPVKILSPAGTMDSGQLATPRLVIRNAASVSADLVKVTFTVRDAGGTIYQESLEVTNLPPKSLDTVEFPGWVPEARDSLMSVAWTYWADDSSHKDDTIRNKFFVRVKDIGVLELLQPTDTLDSGTVVTPTARVWNFGNQSLNFDVQFRIGPYLSTRTLTLPGGGSTVVAAPAPYTAMPGIWQYIVTAVVPGDLHPENNRMQDTIVVRGTIAHDVGVTAILSPGGFLDTATTVTPRGRVKNFTGNTESFWAFFNVSTYSGTPVYAESLQVMVGGNDSSEVSFPSTKFPNPDLYAMACSTAMPGDQNSTNDVVNLPLRVVPSLQGDVGVKSIVEPPSYVPTNTVITPKATWKNYSSQATSFFGYFILINSYNARVYTKVSAETNLNPGEEVTLTFEDFNVGAVEGRWTARCSTFAGDTVPGNDVLQKYFTVSSMPPWDLGWKEVPQVPMTPSGKLVKDGGWVAGDAGTEAVYVAKGAKTRDFYSYDPIGEVWTQKALWPLGTEFKPPYKGAAGTSDGNGTLWATKGNNTFGFWMFNASADTWIQKPDVPVGIYGKKVKGGTSLQYANGFAYLLKGYKNEFYKFNVAAGTWKTLPEAPFGQNVKWDNGSWIVYDGSQFIYAHKAKYHELWKYDVNKDSWVGQLTGMPMVSATGKVKKSKDGGSAAWMMDRIYAFKGGNTNEFWHYLPAEDKWEEDDTIPSLGSSGRKKRIKAGAGLANFNEQALFATKGNKSPEFWRFVETTQVYTPAPREGVMAGSVEPVTGSLQIGPNPLAHGFATMRYNLPQAGLVSLHVYDVTGRSVYAQTLAAGRSGTANLDLRELTAGVYLVKVVSDNFTASQRLVVQK